MLPEHMSLVLSFVPSLGRQAGGGGGDAGGGVDGDAGGGVDGDGDLSSFSPDHSLHQKGKFDGLSQRQSPQPADCT